VTGRRDPAGDLAQLFEALGRDRRIFRELIELFLEHAPPILAQLQAAVAAGDDARVGWAAHRLRGSVAQFSAGEASEALRGLERMARSGDLREARAELQRTESAMIMLIRAMRPYRARSHNRR
jgi:HPt (histidine-containing phosphotransfer) domain-containing protein